MKELELEEPKKKQSRGSRVVAREQRLQRSKKAVSKRIGKRQLKTEERRTRNNLVKEEEEGKKELTEEKADESQQGTESSQKESENILPILIKVAGSNRYQECLVKKD